MAKGLNDRAVANNPQSARPQPALRLRIVFGKGGMIGPGKADLLSAIAETGSIAAAGRRLGMSYKRAWSLVEALNVLFATPLVESARGGPSGGGARLTPAGEDVLARYRRIERAARLAAEADLAALSAMTGAADDMSGRT